MTEQRNRTGMSFLRWIRRHQGALMRLVPGVLGFALLAQGIGALWLDVPGWPNYWGGLVFPPLAILLGAVFLGVALSGSSLLSRVPKDKDGNPIRFPHQDIRKW